MMDERTDWVLRNIPFISVCTLDLGHQDCCVPFTLLPMSDALLRQPLQLQGPSLYGSPGQ